MSPREKRLLECLIENDKIMVKDLRKLVGALNPAQIAYALRMKGWKIKTDYIKVKDRDGKICSPGYYWMTNSERVRAKEFLKNTERADEAALSMSDISKNQPFKTSKFYPSIGRNL